MKLTSFTDYSLRLLMYVAVNNDRLVSIREISEVFEISRNHLMKIVHELGKGGYLKTVRGKNGGFRLAMPAQEINLGKLIRFTEDDLNIVECFGEEKSKCKIVGHCILEGVFQMALNSFFEVLDRYNLEDMSENLHFPPFIPKIADIPADKISVKA